MSIKMSNTIKNFFSFYFNPEVFSEEEAKAELEEIGVDTEKTEATFQNYLKKIEARKRLLEGVQKKEEFEKKLELFRGQLNRGNKASYEQNDLRRAARKGDGTIDDGIDAKLLEYLKNNKNE